MEEVKPKPQCNHTHLQQISITQQPERVHGATQQAVHNSLTPYTTLHSHRNLHIRLSKKKPRSTYECKQAKCTTLQLLCHVFLPSNSSALYLGSMSQLVISKQLQSTHEFRTAKLSWYS